MQKRQNLSTPARPVRRGLMGFPSTPVENPAEKWSAELGSDLDSPCTAYLHIPFCRTRCTFCNFYSGTGTKQEIADYAQLLIREIRDWGPRIRGTVNAVYFGGGSPGILAPDDVRRILSALRSALPLANDTEITWETRVEDLDDAHLDATLENGVNRFSAGVQTFHTGLRRALGRASAKEVILEALQRTMKYNQAAVTVDLLYGLPGQTPEQLAEDLDAVCRAGISGFSFYRFHVHPGLRLAEQIRAGQMPQIPPEEACFELYRLCTERMAAAGANKISFKHYAFGTRERNLYNAISAWKLPCIPFGLGAAGRLGEFRFKQTSSAPDYRDLVLRGEKPIAAAGRMPGDFPASARIGGELNCRMTLHPESVLPFVPEPLRERAAVLLKEAAETQVAKETMLPERFGGYRLTERGCFACPATGSEIMEKFAEAWRM